MMPQQEQPPPPPPFDLQAYISRYDPRSETSLQRLLFLAHHFHEQRVGDGGGGPSPSDDDAASAATIARRAFELAVRRMKATGNHRRYLEEYGAVESAPAAAGGAPSSESLCGAENDAPELVAGGSTAGGGTPLRPRSDSRASTPHGGKPRTAMKHVISRYLDYDPEFVRSSKMGARDRLATMEARLGTAQSHLMKESIRSALLALAEFHRERGELREAWRRVARSREYCANGRQHTQVCLLLVELSVDLREWSSVRDTISRAEHTVMGGAGSGDSSVDVHDPLFRQKLRAALGLAHLAEGRYGDAARSFASVSPELTDQFNSVIGAEDLALYGAVLGLATMDRRTLHETVIDGAFKGRLELVPTMREALRHYSRAEYGQCLSLLQHGSIRRDLLLDIHLHAHVPALLDMIRDRCIVQYFRPYSSVSLEKMGRVFGCNAREMEEVVAKLISGTGIDGAEEDEGMSLGEGARINALEKTLSVEGPRSVERRARRRARVRAAKMGVVFARNAEGMIMRVACVENGITIQSDKRSSGWRSRSSSGGGRARDGGGRHAGSGDRTGGTVDQLLFDSDESISGDDAMDIDNHIVNPNEF